MNLATGPIVRAPADPVEDAARLVAAVVCAAGAGIHAGLVIAHLDESLILGVLFALDAALLGVAAVAINRRGRGVRDVVLVAAVLAATAMAYVLSRTTGLPGLTPEPVDWLGALTTLAELAGVSACLLLILILILRTERP